MLAHIKIATFKGISYIFYKSDSFTKLPWETVSSNFLFTKDQQYVLDDNTQEVFERHKIGDTYYDIYLNVDDTKRLYNSEYYTVSTKYVYSAKSFWLLTDYFNDNKTQILHLGDDVLPLVSTLTDLRYYKNDKMGSLLYKNNVYSPIEHEYGIDYIYTSMSGIQEVVDIDTGATYTLKENFNLVLNGQSFILPLFYSSKDEYQFYISKEVPYYGVYKLITKGTKALISKDKDSLITTFDNKLIVFGTALYKYNTLTNYNDILFPSFIDEHPWWDNENKVLRAYINGTHYVYANHSIVKVTLSNLVDNGVITKEKNSVYYTNDKTVAYHSGDLFYLVKDKYLIPTYFTEDTQYVLRDNTVYEFNSDLGYYVNPKDTDDIFDLVEAYHWLKVDTFKIVGEKMYNFVQYADPDEYFSDIIPFAYEKLLSLVTKETYDLGNVDNTADIDKPPSDSMINYVLNQQIVNLFDDYKYLYNKNFYGKVPIYTNEAVYGEQFITDYSLLNLDKAIHFNHNGLPPVFDGRYDNTGAILWDGTEWVEVIESFYNSMFEWNNTREFNGFNVTLDNEVDPYKYRWKGTKRFNAVSYWDSNPRHKSKTAFYNSVFTWDNTREFSGYNIIVNEQVDPNKYIEKQKLNKLTEEITGVQLSNIEEITN